MKRLPILLAILLLAGNAHGQRSSDDYSVTIETFDVGGNLLSSEDYSIVSSPGTSMIAVNPDENDTVVVTTGFASRAVEVTGLTLNIAPEIEVDEMTDIVIEGTVTIDDGTTESVIASDLDWEITGPITIHSNLAMVGAVYQDSPAALDGVYRGFESSISIQIRDIDPDNFGLYADDGVPDLWQVTTFGEDNPLGRGDADPFGSGQNVRFRYLAGLDPFDPDDLFRIHIEMTETVDIRFSPVRAGRLYTVESSLDLGPDWDDATAFQTVDHDDERLLRIARDPVVDAEFFRVRIALPEE